MANNTAESLKKEAEEDILSYQEQHKQEQKETMCKFSQNKIFRSSIFYNKLLELEQNYQIKVEKRKEKLLNDLKKLQQTDNIPDSDISLPNLPLPDDYFPPYPVDLTLDFQERYYQLCQHYLNFTSKEQALAEIDNDPFIAEYLGFYYKFLRQFIIAKLP